MDADVERERIAQEIRELERILDPGSSGGVGLSESSLGSDSGADSLCSEDLDSPGPLTLEEERSGEASNEEEDRKDRNLPEDPETCLQLNMVYQEVVQEKLAELNLLLAQNRAQQEELTCGLAGSKGPKEKSRKSLPPHMYIGHFMKPYFKDKVTGVGPPANEDMREKAAQGVKSFEELLVTKWKSWEKTLLRKSVMSDRLQRLLQPKLLKQEYLQQKQSRVTSKMEKKVLEKQVRDTEKEIEDIHQLPEEVLLGNRLDSHDWEKISNVNFEGGRSAEEIRKFWQNCEHPSINKQEWSREEVEQLKIVSAQHGHLGWQKIADELGTQRSAFQCLQKFQQHNQDLKRKEWTEEEDSMLTQLVQEMRVGSHIPYRRIVYYMEGRDSMQLIYRWTKSLDPRLRKGCWAPEEDAKLLQAVAKHGAHDWFKIREEVPGRSDAQCRDRYLRRLHFSLKKGRWNPKEEEKLIELIEKYGAGHWAKIAAELPHRTGSQCLSKWKIMVRKQQRRQQRRRRPRRCVQWSSSSEDSGDSRDGDSSSSEDAETESEDSLPVRRGGRALPSTLYVVPHMDLWVPARHSAPEQRKGGTWGWPGQQKAEAATAPGPRAATSRASGEHSRVQSPRSADSQKLGEKEVPLEAVLQVLQANTAAQGQGLKKERPPAQPILAPGPSTEAIPGPHGQLPRPVSVLDGQRHQRQRHTLQRRLLLRRLLMAVGPWVGDITLSCTQASRRPVAVQTRADVIRRQLQGAHLSSTPVFTLLVQLFQIDADGCMEVIRERKAQPPAEPPHLQVRSPGDHAALVGGSHLVAPSAQPSSVQLSLSRSSKRALLGQQLIRGSGPSSAAPGQEPAGQATGPTGGRRPGPWQPESAGPQTTSGPRPKPKTVSELLREKRLREARAKRPMLSPRALPLQLLVSPDVPLPHLQTAPQGSPAAGLTICSPALPGPRGPVEASPGPAGPLQGAHALVKEEGPQPLTLEATAGPATGASRPAPGPSQVFVLSQPSNPGQSPAPSTSQKQGLPHLPPLLPASPSPAQLPGLNLVATPVPASTALPVTWVLTPQGLLPVPVSAMVAVTPAPQHVQTSAAGVPPTLHSPAVARGDLVSTPGQLSSPGAPQGVGETSVPQLPPCDGSGPVGTRGDSETADPLSSDKPPSPQPGPKKGLLDMSLLTAEATEATQTWLRGHQGGCVSPLGSRLPYQPPVLCTLRVLSSLLVHKRALENKAVTLVSSSVTGSRGGSLAEALQAARELVRTQLGDSPAYLLLKARFLATFSLPALLATLPPHGVSTTLSAATQLESDSDPGEPESPDEGHMASNPPEGPQAAPGPSQASVPCCPDTLGDLRVLRSRHSRKRRRLS
ncbi:PREDICTED: snRNA-activating protein complex subunit 4 [Elephantulus edwardii]|uniref:snRNA-activating protein complex subunit 4 n=1 Tax=Elephantulus edwardii TaxID=28737 RepID=UPI0003F0A167|nr:PREDICTED: snRNA-activating protein complex subunit 4 [Elephantulus edwardii]